MKFKYILTFVAIPLLFAILLGLITITLYKDSLHKMVEGSFISHERYIETRTREKLDFLSSMGSSLFTKIKQGELDLLGDFITDNPETTYIAIFDRSNRLVFSRGRLSNETSVRIMNSVVRDEQGKVIGKIVIHLSEARILPFVQREIKMTQKAINDILMVLLLVFIVCMLGIIVLGTLILDETLLTPLDALIKLTQRISMGDLESRLVNLPNDEIGEVGRAFNTMVESLKIREGEIQESADFLRQILQAAKDYGVITFDREDKITLFSLGAFHILGYLCEEIIGTSIKRIFGNEIIESFHKIKEKLNQGETGFDNETHIVRKNGEVFLAHLSLYPLKNPSGDVTAYLAVFKDISQQKELEEKLSISEYNYRTLVETSLAMVYLIQDGVFVYVNPSLCSAFGYTREEMIGMPVIDTVAEPHKETVALNIRKRIEGEMDAIRYEFVGKRKDGSTFDIEVHGARIIYRGRPAIQGTGIDVTERKRFEQELIEANKRIQEELVRKEKLAVLGQITGTVSHELRNPLGVISSSIYYIRSRIASTDEKIIKHLDRMDRQVQICNNIIQDLLEYTRQWIPEPVPTDINKLIEQSLADLKIPLNVRLEKKFDQRLTEVNVDPYRIRQVITNLVTNAIQSLKEGGTITVETRAQGDWMALEVSDNGTGIRPEDLERIFEPLFTTKARGIGLGLSIVKRVVEAHKGTINVTSKLGEGTKIEIKLPTTFK